MFRDICVENKTHVLAKSPHFFGLLATLSFRGPCMFKVSILHPLHNFEHPVPWRPCRTREASFLEDLV